MSSWDVFKMLLLLLGLFGHVRMLPMSLTKKSFATNLETQSQRDKVPLLKPVQRVKRGTNNDDMSQAKINLFQIENLDITNGILRNLMIKPIAAKKKK